MFTFSTDNKLYIPEGYEQYTNLANAVVKSACDDYMKAELYKLKNPGADIPAQMAKNWATAIHFLESTRLSIYTAVTWEYLKPRLDETVLIKYNEWKTKKERKRKNERS